MWTFTTLGNAPPPMSNNILLPPPSKWTSYVYHSLSQQRKKYRIKIISSYVILIHHGNQALRFFFISLKGNGNNSYFCITSKNLTTMTFHWLELIIVIRNFSTKNTFTCYFQYFRREPQSKCSILKGVCVYFKSCIWKTSIVKSNYLFFSLTLLKRIADTFKCLVLPKRITNWYFSVLQVEVILLKVLFCRQKLGKP